jgi:hypothetical protein
LTRTQLLDAALSPTHHRKGESSSAPGSSIRSSIAELRAPGCRDNSHVLNILPATTFRTIDLAGKKNSGRLFSGFCAERAIFLVKSWRLAEPLADKLSLGRG